MTLQQIREYVAAMLEQAETPDLKLNIAQRVGIITQVIANSGAPTSS